MLSDFNLNLSLFIYSFEVVIYKILVGYQTSAKFFHIFGKQTLFCRRLSFICIYSGGYVEDSFVFSDEQLFVEKFTEKTWSSGKFYVESRSKTCHSPLPGFLLSMCSTTRFCLLLLLKCLCF